MRANEMLSLLNATIGAEDENVYVPQYDENTVQQLIDLWSNRASFCDTSIPSLSIFMLVHTEYEIFELACNVKIIERLEMYLGIKANTQKFFYAFSQIVGKSKWQHILDYWNKTDCDFEYCAIHAAITNELLEFKRRVS